MNMSGARKKEPNQYQQNRYENRANAERNSYKREEKFNPQR